MGENEPGHKIKRSFMERENSLNCGIRDYRGYVKIRR